MLGSNDISNRENLWNLDGEAKQPESAVMQNGIKNYNFMRKVKNRLSTYLGEVREIGLINEGLDILVSPCNKILIPRVNLTIKSVNDLSLEINLNKYDFFKNIKELGFIPINTFAIGGGYAGLYLDLIITGNLNFNNLLKQAIDQGYSLAKVLQLDSDTNIITLYLLGENKELSNLNHRVLKQTEHLQQPDRYKGVPELKHELEREGYIIFTPRNFVSLKDEDKNQLILAFRKSSIKVFADRFKKTTNFKSLVQDDVNKNLETENFDYNFRIVANGNKIVAAVFSNRDSYSNSFCPEFMLANKSVKKPKGIATYLLHDLVKDIRKKNPEAIIHAGFELHPDYNLKTEVINPGCGVFTAINAGFLPLNQELTRELKIPNGVMPFFYNRMVHRDIIPTHAVWMEYPKQ
ncbi:hypothetical protein [Coleofasciculus sp. FACHB-129]|uniref:hypothetical protein n=1 Tax=Cyanophyceae TaxID=3028117 RepID=UPI001684AC9B|nr:hypothetical protein [Coleofasciculus sp. FACHB-129]MBD1894880.1 hypothetical protein [Coleofasciculus sp. FACHB-129]